MNALYINAVSQSFKAIGYRIEWIIPGSSFLVYDGKDKLGEIKTFKGELRFSNEFLESIASFGIGI